MPFPQICCNNLPTICSVVWVPTSDQHAATAAGHLHKTRRPETLQEMREVGEMQSTSLFAVKGIETCFVRVSVGTHRSVCFMSAAVPAEPEILSSHRTVAPSPDSCSSLDTGWYPATDLRLSMALTESN